MLTLDLGRRVELVSMDPHCHDISLALYLQGHRYRIHTYSRHDAAAHRVNFLRSAMASLGAMTIDKEELSFPCGSIHLAAVRRLFLTVAKLSTGTELPAPMPLETLDRKSGKMIQAQSHGNGEYQVPAEGPVKNGLRKLAEMDDKGDILAFPLRDIPRPAHRPAPPPRTQRPRYTPRRRSRRYARSARSAQRPKGITHEQP